MCVTGMIFPDSNASYFEKWYITFFVAFVVVMVIMISNDKK